MFNSDFFSHENQSCPLSLSNYGALMSGTKADLLACVSELVPHNDTVKPQETYHAGHGIYANSSVVTCSEWIWCLMHTGRIA